MTKEKQREYLFIGVHVNNLDCRYLKILVFVEVLDIFVQVNRFEIILTEMETFGYEYLGECVSG